MSKEDIDLIWEKINCEACCNENINYCKEKCECKCREFIALENILSQLQELGEINFRLLNNGVPKKEFDELRLRLKKEKNENEANKKRIEELEEERKLLNAEYVDNIPEGQLIGINKLQYKEYLYLKSNSILKAKVEEILEKEELPNVIVGGRRNSKTLNYGKKLGRIELCKELLKDGGE